MKLSLGQKINIAVCGALTVAMLITIFVFSQQSGGKSSQISNSVATFLFRLTGKEVPKNPSSAVIFAGLTIRKLAHVAAYFLLGICVYLFSNSLFALRKRHYSNIIFIALAALFACFLFACADELHQYFISGRVASFKDVGIDAIGFSTSILICTIIKLLVFLIANISKNKTA